MTSDGLFVTGNLFKARITRIEPMLAAAFVDFGAERYGYLPFSAIQDYDERLHKEGTIVTVRITAPETDKKGAAVEALKDAPNDAIVHELYSPQQKSILKTSTTYLLTLCMVGIILYFISGGTFAQEKQDDIRSILIQEFDAPVRAFSTQNFGRSQFKDAVSIIIPEKGHKKSLYKIREKLPEGVIAFIGTTRNLSPEQVKGVELVVINSTDKFDILRVSQSDGINYGITNEKLIEKLKSWDEKYEVDIWHAETDTIQLTIESLPKDLSEFAQEIYEFCPDIVDQGSGNISDISDYLKAEKAIYLWWD